MHEKGFHEQPSLDYDLTESFNGRHIAQAKEA